MTPEGRARICARCDKAVHDLASYTLDEAEALLRREPGACVRARIGDDGSVALKPSRRRDPRRMVIAAAATASLLIATAPAAAKKDQPGGAIAGRMYAPTFRTRVIATGADGRSFRTTVKVNGRFRIRHLPTGTYTLTFRPSCGESWTLENVAVQTGETFLPDVRPEGGCITIGMIRIEDSRG